MRIVMMGVQGSGKGTQSKLLSKKLHLPHISTGDLLRANISQKTELGTQARQYTDNGELVPDELVIAMVADRVGQDDAKDGFILDGFPRSAMQLAACEHLWPVDRAILMELDDTTAIQRLAGRSECAPCGILYGANRKPAQDGQCDQCGAPLKQRTDDKDAQAVKKRLEAYHNEIDTMVRYYQWRGVLRRINAAGSVDDVLQASLAALKS